MITAKGAEEEKIRGFTKGADDYLSKPFSIQELLLRIEAVTRRVYPNTSEKKVDKLDGLFLDHQNNTVKVADRTIDLTTIQFNLLNIFILNKGEVLSKPYLYKVILNKKVGAYDRSLDMHLSRIRKKLNDANWDGGRLQTVHGKGYCLK